MHPLIEGRAKQHHKLDREVCAAQRFARIWLTHLQSSQGPREVYVPTPADLNDGSKDMGSSPNNVRAVNLGDWIADWLNSDFAPTQC